MANALPTWTENESLKCDSTVFASNKAKLDSLIILLEKLSTAERFDRHVILEMLALSDLAGDIAVSLLTACKAAQALTARDARVAARRADIMSDMHRLQKVDAVVLQKIFLLQSDSELMENQSVKARIASASVPAPYQNTRREDMMVIAPLVSLYSHLKSVMRLSVNVPGRDSSVVMGFSTAESVLKNSTDMTLRRRVYGAFNAWLSENAIQFADLTNALSAYRINVANEAGCSVTDHALRQESLSHEAYFALTESLQQYSERAREAVTMQARILAAVMNETEVHNVPADMVMPVSFLFSPLPGAKIPPCIESFANTVQAVKDSIGVLVPQVVQFLDSELEGGWIEARNLSGGEGGTWCAAVPLENRVAVFADFQPGVNRAVEFAHCLGEAYLRSVWQSRCNISRDPSATVCEIAGRFFGMVMQHHLMTVPMDGRYRKAVYWQALRRIVVNMLYLPFRHDLAKGIHELRAQRCLSVGDINNLAKSAWNKYFGDRVDGVDQYVWVHKTHFYQTHTAHYDFQYSLGCLCANRLFDMIRRNGVTSCGAGIDEFFADSAFMSLDELITKHLGGDPADMDFWLGAAELTVKNISFVSHNLAAFD